ncbi:MAG: iron transporter [Lachnospiraceae bacterium]|nr:iron transporter [Lachnospiraceae bacterium]
MRRKLVQFMVSMMVVGSLVACGNASGAKETDGVVSSTTVASGESQSSETAETLHVGEDRTKAGEDASAKASLGLEDGVYLAEFHTDSSMFHVNETKNGQGVLTVVDGVGTIHLLMPSKNTVGLYLGLAEDASKPEAAVIEPSLEQVTYGDGSTEEVNAFDLPVPVLDEEFDCALVGTKGKWYDHKVSVTNAVPYEESQVCAILAEGSYEIPVELQGGSGKATITSPAKVEVTADGAVATIVWSSKNYDYMIVGGEKYLPVTVDPTSVFEIPVENLCGENPVIADTVAMSKPHEVEYVLYFHGDQAKALEAK